MDQPAPSTAFEWIDTQDDLNRVCRALQKCKIIAVDTESNSLFAYRERVCLIQIATPGQNYLIDPLRIPDMTVLAPILASPAIVKVFHAAEYDLICLKRDFHFGVRNIFDTMHASRMLGMKNLGLSAVLKEQLGVQLEKKYQRANWGQRPLPQELKNYAYLDSKYLIPLREVLVRQLKQARRLSLAQEDFIRLETVRVPPVRRGHAWRISGSHKLNEKQLGVLKQLWAYRELRASNEDRPVFKVMLDRDLIELARNMPGNRQALFAVNSISPRVLERHAQGILRAVKQGLEKPVQAVERFARPDKGYLTRLNLLRSWRTRTAQQSERESDIILPRESMEAIAKVNPQSLEQLRPLLDGQSWRLDKYGAEIIEVLKKGEKS